jgi:hypothetical protein
MKMMKKISVILPFLIALPAFADTTYSRIPSRTHPLLGAPAGRFTFNVRFDDITAVCPGEEWGIALVNDLNGGCPDDDLNNCPFSNTIPTTNTTGTFYLSLGQTSGYVVASCTDDPPHFQGDVEHVFEFLVVTPDTATMLGYPTNLFYLLAEDLPANVHSVISQAFPVAALAAALPLALAILAWIVSTLGRVKRK